jgi:hypothetical protein
MAIISPRGTCGFGPPAAIAIAVIATADAVVDLNTLALGKRGVKRPEDRAIHLNSSGWRVDT